ncbi:MAG: hypothetical protein KatS3mg121_0612 [Gammaproteobacteria bacterium]|nr:MAG: hypothetical protein KatS3mg121_0612 [Gammaproteobacteria bacterium]
MKRKTTVFERLIGVAVAVLCLLGAGSGPLRELEWQGYALGVRITPPRTPSPLVSVIGIDDASLEALGPWPWSWDRLAELLRLLDRAGARAVALLLPLDEVQNRLALDLLEAERRRGVLPDAAARRTAAVLETEPRLAAALRAAGRAYLGVPYRLAAGPGTPAELGPVPLPAVPVEGTPPLWSRLTDPLGLEPAPVVRALHPPRPALLRAAAGAGLGPALDSVDRSSFAPPLLLEIDGAWRPTLALQLAAEGPLRAEPGRGVIAGDRVFATDARFRALPFFYRSKDGLPPFAQYSFHKVLGGDIRPAVFEDKIVLVGATSPRLAAALPTPLGVALPPVLIEAHTLSALERDDLYRRPPWSDALRLGLFVLVALYLAALLPRLSLATGMAVTGLLLILLLNTQFVAMALAGVWLPLLAPASAMLLGHLLLGAKRALLAQVEHVEKELSKANRALGQAYHQQGQLDLAFERYRQCEVDEELLSLAYNLGLDYERKRQFNKAVNVFRFIRAHRPDYRDAKERIRKNLQTSQQVVLGKPGGDGESTLILPKSGMQKPMLGRYQIESEIGRGAMGTVYLGVDPKIGRTVAIKTLALSAEFAPDQIEEVKKRFFREARTAGRLNHYNIVTIYDVGEEQDLAYIAMDYLQGVDMSKFTKKDNLLKVSEVFAVIIQIADALNYAHAQNVVHRDIKPANIIYDRRTRKPTLTDFGIAHLTDTTKTKTGMILGTPSFMSPEQLAGRPVDGRSDLFSLGVTFFQLLTGELPFVGETISTLMYKIANEPPRDILEIRPALPPCVKAIIEKALKKDPDERFQTGAEFAAAVRRCLQAILSRQGRRGV